MNKDLTYNKTKTGSGGISEAPIDGTPYVRENAGWVSESTGGIPSDQAGVQVKKNSSLVVTSTPTFVDFDAVDVENIPTEVNWDIGNPERITAIVGGLYQVGASINADNGSNTNEVLLLELFLNGIATGETIETNIIKNGGASINPTRLVELNDGDYISFKVNQTTGSGDITINGNSKLSLLKLQGEKGDTGNTGAGANIIIQKDDVAIGTVTSTLNFEGTNITSAVDEGSGKTTITIEDGWKPNSVPLGSVLSSGATFFVNGGAGVYLSFSGTADDSMLFNDSLSKGGNMYDGSDLKLKLHWRLSIDGGVGDTVGWIVDYAILKDGDNATTTITTIAQNNIDVSGELQDILFETTLGLMDGVANGEMIMLTLIRNSTGAGADSFSGNAEIIGLELVKV